MIAKIVRTRSFNFIIFLSLVYISFFIITTINASLTLDKTVRIAVNRFFNLLEYF